MIPGLYQLCQAALHERLGIINKVEKTYEAVRGIVFMGKGSCIF